MSIHSVLPKRLAGSHLRHILFLLQSLASIHTLSGQQIIQLSNPSACQLGIPLADYSCPDDPALNYYEPNRFQISVTQAPGGILGVDVALTEVRLILSHEWVSDVNIRLISPGGTSAQLIQNAGGREDHFGDPDDTACNAYTRLRVYACQPISSGVPPFLDGAYRAAEDLWVFNDGTTDPRGVWQLLICDDLPGESGILEYVELVFEPIACLPLEQLRVVGVDSTTVEFGFGTNDACGDVLIELGPPGFTPGIGAAAGAGGSVYVFAGVCSGLILQGLAPETSFDAYARRYCPQTNSYSANTCGLRLSTLCQPPPTTSVETFDQRSLCAPVCTAACPQTEGQWRNVQQGDQFDWITYSGPTPSAPLTGPSADVSGGGRYVYIEANGTSCTQGSTAWLLSGCYQLDKRGSDRCHLSFNFHMSGINIGQLSLQVSPDGGLSWTTLWQRAGNQGNQWRKAYIDLSAYNDGQLLQFRFAGRKGNGIYGDIAIDNIVIHGSHYLGYPDRRYYADADGDGFGRSGDSGILSCLETPPPGFSANNLDCNDNPATGAGINPAASEIPCNGIDENCNSAQVDDDIFLPSPLATADTICSGEIPLLCATPLPDAYIIWYSEAEGIESYIDFADCISPVLPPNETPFPQVYRFYAEQTNFSCTSRQRTETTIVVNPVPRPAAAAIAVCPGDIFQPGSINVNDENLTGGTVSSWHTALPASTDNRLADNIAIIADRDTTFYLLMTNPQGCQQQGAAEVGLKPLPTISFSPADSFSLCRQAAVLLEASAAGSTAPYDYLWDDGSTEATRAVTAATIGQTTLYHLTVTDSEGCRSSAAASVLTTNSIDSVRVFTQAVSACDGADGSLMAVPLNGFPPFSYTWSSANGEGGSGVFTTDTLRLSGLRQGSYRITITDALSTQCSVRLRGIRIQGPGFLLAEPNVTTPTCHGARNGRICLNVSGSNNLTYLWSNGKTTACIDSLPAGPYQVTISNGACTTIETFELEEPPPLQLSVVGRNPACPGETNGQLTASATGGTAPYTYSWHTGQQSRLLSNIPQGSYSVQVSDVRGCQLSAVGLLTDPPVLALTIDTFISPGCADELTGLMRVSGSGGTPPYRFHWPGATEGALQTQLAAGSYTVTMTDQNNCMHSDSLLLPEPSPLILNLVNFTQPACQGRDDGQIQVLALGGTPPYSYLFNEQPTEGPVITALGQGNFSILAIDSRACRSNFVEQRLSYASNLQLTADIQAPDCVGRSDGQLTVSLQGGLPPYVFSWQDGSTQAQRQSLPAGLYPLSVADQRGCQLDTTLVLAAPQVFAVSVIATQPSCHNATDGLINTLLSGGGSGLISYQWNDGGQQPQRAGLGAGSYQLTISDEIGCRYISDTLRLQNPLPLNFSTIDAVDNLCHGGATGGLEVALAGGTPPYNYYWIHNGQTTPVLDGLPGGSYRMIAGDSRGCLKDTSFVVSAPDPLLVQLLIQGNSNCTDTSALTVGAVVNGGTPPYTFSWNNGDSTQTLINPLQGDYSLTVTDANQCQVEAGSIKIRERIPPLLLDTFAVIAVSCFGQTDASLTASVSGGSGLYRYHFSAGLADSIQRTSYTLAGLPHSNVYSVTITDLVSGCSVQAERGAVQPLPLYITRDSIRPVECAGGSNGAIFTSIYGGTAPYTTVWTNTQGDTVSLQQQLMQAADTTYTLWVTDANGCSTSMTDSSLYTLGIPIELIDSLTNLQSPACRFEPTGSIELHIRGGQPPYQYMWSNGQTTEDLVNIAAGSYQLTVTDQAGCRRVFPAIELTQPLTLLTIISQQENISCNGLADGHIAVTATGGIPPYAFSWLRNGQLLPSENGTTLSPLAAANYAVVVMDANGCMRTRAFNITEPAPLTVSIVQIPGIPDSLYANVSGGSPPYTFLWSTGATTDRTGSLAAGDYSLSVVDANDCPAQADILVADTSIPPTGIQTIRLFPNPNQGGFWLRTSERGAIISMPELSIYTMSGQCVFRQKLASLSEQDTYIDTGGLQAGMYQLRITAETFFAQEKLIICR